MSALERKQRERVRKARGEGEEQTAYFLAVVNGERFELIGVGTFDPQQWATHHALAEHLRTIAGCLKADRDAGAIMWLVDGTPAVDFRPLLASAENLEPREDETAEAAAVRHWLARDMTAYVRGFLQERHFAAYRFLNTCVRDGCSRWFFERDRSQWFCSPACKNKTRR